MACRDSKSLPWGIPPREGTKCQVHVARNVLAKVPQKLKQKVADDIRSIFYASSREKAMEFSTQFTERWSKDVPSAVKCYKIPWIAVDLLRFSRGRMDFLRTTNVIERLNKELGDGPNRWRSLPEKMPVIHCYLLSDQDGNYWRSTL